MDRTQPYLLLDNLQEKISHPKGEKEESVCNSDSHSAASK